MISKKIHRYKSGIYKITNLVNNKIYVGSSQNLYNRKHTHATKLKLRTHTNKHLENAYHKYGFDNFLFEVIEYCDINILNIREQHWINVLEPEYNLIKFVSRKNNMTVSENCRKKISQTLKKKYANHEIIAYRQNHLWIPIDVYDLAGNFIQSFPCIAEAVRSLWKTEKSNDHVLANNRNGRARCGNFICIKKGEQPPLKYKNPQCKKTFVYDTLLHTTLVFESLKECEKYFNVKGRIKYVPGILYRKRFLFNHVQSKFGELLENPEVDNQQPSIENDKKVSMKVQRLIGEESTNNPDTSAELPLMEDDIV